MASIVRSTPQSAVDWFWTVPLVSSAYDTVTSTYEGAKDRNGLTRFTFGTFESSVKLAGRCASPFVNKLEKPISIADSYALKKLQSLEANYPLIKKPTDEVIAQSKETVLNALDKGSKRVARNPAVKLMGTGISAGNDVLGCTINAGRRSITTANQLVGRSITTANQLVGRSVDTCLDATEAMVKYLLPVEKDSSPEKELLITSPTDTAKGAKLRRRRRREERREQHKTRRTGLMQKPITNLWSGRLERAQEILGVATYRTMDRVCDHLEWCLDQLDSLYKMLGFVDVYERLVEAGNKVKAMNPFKSQQQKFNILSEDEEEVPPEKHGVVYTLQSMMSTTQTTVTASILRVSSQLKICGQDLFIWLSDESTGNGIPSALILRTTELKDTLLATLGYERAPASRTLFSVVTPSQDDAVEDPPQSGSDSEQLSDESDNELAPED